MKNEKTKCGFSFSINIANFEVFLQMIKLTKNLFFLKSDIVLKHQEFVSKTQYESALIYLTVHGTLHHSDTFLLPWLIFHVPLIIGLFCAFVCIIILLDPIVYRAFGVIPMVFGVYLLWCWIKVSSCTLSNVKIVLLLKVDQYLSYIEKMQLISFYLNVYFCISRRFRA